MNKAPLVSIIIVNWNGGEVFRECLRSLNKIKYKNWELIIVDNGSTDGTKKYATVKNNKNLGFAEGNNLGFEKAKGEYVLLLNNDTTVEKDFLNKLVDRIQKDKKIGLIQPKIHVMSDPSFIDSAGSYLTRTGFLQHWGLLSKDGKEFNKEKYIFSAKGACVLIRREVIEKVGLFDKDYGSYLEDTDFSWKAWIAGYKVLFYPKAEIYHKIGFSSKRQNQVFVNYHSFKNRLATLFKNLSFLNLILIGGTHLIILFGLSFYYIVTLRIENGVLVLRAIYWNIKNIEDLIEKRSEIQKLRVKKDNELFKYILLPIDAKGMLSHFIRSEKVFSGVHEV